jgi:4-amino-4-deoxy-L-arabinose transferase-like glycosyltransferase
MNSSRTWNTSALLLGAGVLCVAAFLSLWQLGKAPLWDYDESTYAEIAHEALEGGPVVAPTFMYTPFFEKPPLLMWLVEGSVRVFGESEWSLRLPSALAAVATVLVVMLLAFELSGSTYTGVLAGAILATTAPFVETARQVRLDVPVALFVTLSVYGFVRGLRDRRWFLVFGVAAALAALTKSVVVVFALAAVPLFALYLWDFHWLKEKYFWFGVLAAVVVALPWHWYETVLYGNVFWRDYIGINVTARFNEELFNMQSVSNADYVWYLARFAAPWTQVFVFGAVAVFVYRHHFSPRVRAGMFACGTLVILVLAVFFAAATKAPTYLIPAYPFAAVAVSLAILGEMNFKYRAYYVIVAIAIAICLAIGLYASFYDGFHQNPYYSQTDQLSLEERAVAEQLVQHTKGVWYVYGSDREVGSIMYYTRNMHPKALTGTEHPKPGDTVLMYGEQRQQFFSDYHAFSTVVLYGGAQLLLLEVVSED